MYSEAVHTPDELVSSCTLLCFRVLVTIHVCHWGLSGSTAELIAVAEPLHKHAVFWKTCALLFKMICI